ncbi:MAG: methyltransferase domain-containing protein [Bacteroidia bacterium]|nr:methyltransferase domain-containing protein [Bacteroidia bacterium]
MTSQKEIFLASEADQWFIRNKKSYENTQDEIGPIIQSLIDIEIAPKKVLEIGCSNGMRLNNFNKVFNSECYGIDPSIQAINNGKKEFPSISLIVGSADALPFDDNSFDMIVFGFCLYLCDRKDLFKIAFEADRCLSANGVLVIMDFHPPFPYKNIYTHTEGVFSYKMNYSKMFSWNPSYNVIFNKIFSHSGFSKMHIPDEKVGITILNKNEEFAYPLEPYKRGGSTS